jgi:hypothetical protein
MNNTIDRLYREKKIKEFNVVSLDFATFAMFFGIACFVISCRNFSFSK